MPCVIYFPIVVEGPLPERMEDATQGWFLALTSLIDEEWNTSLHKPNETRPYSLAARAAPPPPTPGPGGRRPSAWRSAVEVRLGVADDGHARDLLSRLGRLDLPDLDGAPTRLARLPSLDRGDPDVRFCSWDQLTDAPSSARISVSFETPTTFSRRGVSLPLLTEERLVASWSRSWSFAPMMPKGIGDIDLQALRVTRFDLRSEPMSVKGGIRIGAVGGIEFTWDRAASPEMRRSFAALVSIADFLGTGAKTTLGMGQTRVSLSD
jgi:hypothetical protein